jgi:hypothetical protein
MAAWKSGKQGVLQPTYAASDRRFSGKETKILVSIASNCSGNKRAVIVSKRLAYISQGFRPNMNPELFDMVWQSWLFKSNFMFNLVIYKHHLHSKQVLLSNACMLIAALLTLGTPTFTTPSSSAPSPISQHNINSYHHRIINLLPAL